MLFRRLGSFIANPTLSLGLLISSISFGNGAMKSVRGATAQSTYVITEAGRHSSLDPLDADATINLPVARMIYLTPFEMSDNDKLTSGLLESFDYSVEQSRATWVVRRGLTFEDGTPVTPEDVAFALTRMAFSRPLFPVIREIEGVEEWRRSASPLSNYPKGIEVSGNKITIRFAKRVEHPLFRFVLELFSVIPKSCVDLKTNKLSCAKPPASGYYRIARESSDEVVFERRDAFPREVTLPRPPQIRFLYRRPKDILQSSAFRSPETVIAGNESSFSNTEIAHLKTEYSLKPLPKNRFAALLVNPSVKAFSDQSCRLAFLQRFRQKLVEAGMPGPDVEASLTMQILPGYLDLQSLERRVKIVDRSIVAACEEALRKSPIKFVVWEGQRFDLAEKAVVETLKSFGVPMAGPQVTPSNADAVDQFIKGESPLRLVGSGFWPQDPFGDLQMLFTPNLHKVLQYVAADDKLQELIARLRTPLPPKTKRDLAEQLNVHMYEQGMLGVYRHTRRFFLRPKTRASMDVPLSLTSPSPWQVFEHPPSSP